MDQFKTGFIDAAVAGGQTPETADVLWKRAQEYPGTGEMFKNLNVDPAAEVAPPGHDLQSLSHVMEQQKVHNELAALKQQLGI